MALDDLQAHVATLAADGDVSSAQREELDTAVDAIRSEVSAALAAGLDGDEAARTAALDAARQDVQELRAWLASADLAEAGARPTWTPGWRPSRRKLVSAYLASVGVSVALPPVAGVAVPGGTVSGTVEVTNTGTAPITGLEGTVTVGDLGEATVSLASVPAGGSAQLPFELAVPKQADPGGYDATLALDLTRDGEAVHRRRVDARLGLGDLRPRRRRRHHRRRTSTRPTTPSSPSR